jgi:ribosomal protein S18 acetylase RimI-like enzyme
MNIQNLSDFVSKAGVVYQVKRCATIAHTPVLPFFLKSFAEVIEEGFADSLIVGTNSHSAVYIEFENRVVACVVYAIPKDSQILWKLLTAVDAQHQRQGIATHLNQLVEKIAVYVGCSKIQSTVHKNNTSMIQLNLDSGMTSDYIKFNKDLNAGS